MLALGASMPCNMQFIEACFLDVCAFACCGCMYMLGEVGLDHQIIAIYPHAFMNAGVNADECLKR
eukprot:c40984_g1_i1 orf=86-280(+)